MSQEAPKKVSYINRATCGLQTTPDPISDNLTPQETTNQESGTVGADGAGLPCSGSSVVAESGRDNSLLTLLMKSCSEDLEQGSQQSQLLADGE